MSPGALPQAARPVPLVGTGLRLLGWLGLGLALLLLFALAARAAPGSFELAADDALAGRALYGIGPLEASPAGAFRWSGESWGVALFGFVRPGPVLLTLEASAARPDGTPEAELRLDDGSLAPPRFTVAREWRRYQVLLEPTAVTDEYQVISFASSTFAPGSSADGRALGVAVRRVRADQLPLDDAPPLPARALFLAGVVLLAALALRRAVGWRPIAIGGAVLALAAPLALLQVYAAPALGYWLPNTWRLLALAAVALASLAASDWLAARARVIAQAGAALTLGCGLGLAATLALWLGAPPALGLPVLLAGAALASAALRHVPTPAGAALAWPAGRIPSQVWLLAGATLAALALRLYRLNSLPIAVWRDEVYHGLLAQRIWRDPTFRPVYVADVDLPALLFYLQSPFVGLFGGDLWTLRVAPALAGALTPLAAWFALRPILGARPALIAAWGMALAAWGLYMSRWGFPVIFDPLLTLLAVGCVWRGLGPAAPPWRAAGLMALGGLCAGLAVYTYHTGRAEPLAVAALALARLWRRPLRPRLAPLAAGALAFGLALAPLASYALTHPQEFNKRVNSVGIFGAPGQPAIPPLLPLEQNAARYALMWHVAGDQNPRHYAPGRPVLDPLAGLAALLGLGLAWRSRRPAALALLAWLAIGLLPGIFSDAAPHAMRSIGAFAPAAALAGLGLDALLGVAATRWRWLAPALAGVALAGVAAWNAQLYFRTTSDQQVMFNLFETTVTLLARGARAAATTATPSGAHYQAYLWDTNTAGKVAPFLIGDAPVGHFDGQRLSPPPGPRALLLLAGDAPPDVVARAVQALGPGARLLRTGPTRPYTSYPIYAVYGAGPEAQWLADHLPLL